MKFKGREEWVQPIQRPFCQFTRDTDWLVLYVDLGLSERFILDFYKMSLENVWVFTSVTPLLFCACLGNYKQYIYFCCETGTPTAGFPVFCLFLFLGLFFQHLHRHSLPLRNNMKTSFLSTKSFGAFCFSFVSQMPPCSDKVLKQVRPKVRIGSVKYNVLYCKILALWVLKVVCSFYALTT